MAIENQVVFLDLIIHTNKTTEETVSFIYDVVFEDWKSFLENIGNGEQDKLEVLVKAMDILAKCVKDMESKDKIIATKTIKILSATCGGSELLNVIAATIIKHADNPLEMEKLLDNTRKVCDVVLEKLPMLAKDKLLSLICTCIGILTSNEIIQESKPNLLQNFVDIQQRVVSLNELDRSQHSNRREENSEDIEKQYDLLTPPENFRELSIIPSLAELLDDSSPFLRPNKVLGPYRGGEHYLDVHFRLLREDFFRPLRQALQHFKKNKNEFLKSVNHSRPTHQNDCNVRVYQDVKYLRSETSGIGMPTHHLFVMPHDFGRSINWTKSKRLLPGCLVLLTPDFCKSAIFGITATPPFDPKKRDANLIYNTRQELTKGILRLEIEDGKGWMVQANKAYVMIECEAFFEAYRHNLNILQEVNFLSNDYGFEEIRLAKYIVEASSYVEPPQYLKSIPGYKLLSGGDGEDDTLVNPLDTESWPQEKIQNKMRLAEDQYRALEAAITSELAVIQGPPGTGKTYVGLQIVKTLLVNKNRGTVPKSPILILCHTNHALDQFLELLIRSISNLNVVRVGAQSKSKTLKPFMLNEHRHRMMIRRKEEAMYNYEFQPDFQVQWASQDEKTAFIRLKRLESTYKTLEAEINEMKNPNGLLNFRAMIIWRKLDQVLPCTLNLATKNEAWLLPDSQTLGNTKFNPTHEIANIFGIDPVFVENFINKLKRAQYQKEAANNSNELEYSECHLYELLENRLSDFDPGDSYDMHRGINFHRDQIYISDCSIKLCRERIAYCNKVFHMQYGCFYEVQQRNGNLNQVNNFAIWPEKLKTCYRDLRKVTVECGNRAILLETIFQLYLDGKLPLPDVSSEIGFYYSEEDWSEDDFSLDEFEQYSKKPSRRIVVDDVDNYPIRKRWAIYFELLKVAIEFALESRQEISEKLVCARGEYKERRQMVEGTIMRYCDIIGMTTTGAAKRHSLLDIATPNIIIVEEAAEILESHIVTSLTEKCKHLILIGDHLQLRPSANVYELEQKYRLNISLFERMTLNNVPFCTLKTQHRMRPEISNLIIGPIYEELKNHPKVYDYPKIKGVVRSLFFLDHKEHESTDPDLLSKSNFHEANFLIALCYYFLKQGYSSSQITILTTYSGQMFLLNKFLSPAHNVRVTSVDNFQGEENDIILLSLVRSNEKDKVGFVGIDNRICVALSRARHGLFVIGNMSGLSRASQTWSKIVQKLNSGENIGNQLELICERHSNITKVNCGNHFAPLVNGGCAQPCLFHLPCNHLCPEICHAQDPNHVYHKCLQRCNKVCSLNHLCPAPCFATCPPCPQMVYRKLECNHIMCVQCHVDPAKIKCLALVVKRLPCEFNHDVELYCHLDVNEVQCPVLVDRILPCNHMLQLECGLPLEEVKCPVMVEKVLPCEHSAKVKCSRDLNLVNCNVKVERELECGHMQSGSNVPVGTFRDHLVGTSWYISSDQLVRHVPFGTFQDQLAQDVLVHPTGPTGTANVPFGPYMYIVVAYTKCFACEKQEKAKVKEDDLPLLGNICVKIYCKCLED